jgi:hypothetical protein
MPKSPLELLAKARIAEYRQRALANSRTDHHQPSSSFWKKLGAQRTHHAQRRLATTDPS